MTGWLNDMLEDLDPAEVEKVMAEYSAAAILPMRLPFMPLVGARIIMPGRKIDFKPVSYPASVISVINAMLESTRAPHIDVFNEAEPMKFYAGGTGPGAGLYFMYDAAGVPLPERSDYVGFITCVQGFVLAYYPGLHASLFLYVIGMGGQSS